MVKVLAVCGNGMGTSMVIKMKVQKVFKMLDISAQVSYASLEQAEDLIEDFDLVLASAHVADDLNFTHTKIISLMNLIDENELYEKLVGALK